jgi:glycosyltransferase involved in cell wall biosynthesis
MRGAGVRVVAVSNFTAGALAEGCHAGVLPPGLSRGWFDMLVDESARTRAKDTGVYLVTTFRLDQWRSKGLPQLLDAVAALGRPEIHVAICGTGEPPQELQNLVHRHPRCTLRSGVSDRELARELAEADLFVLATRTKAGRHASGEGFGLVLLEAQVAGTPVIGPAFGGSHDAYIEGVTGIAPTDETAGALTKVLDEVLQDPCRLEQMGKRSAEWARECFAPEHYASRAIGRLL